MIEKIQTLLGVKADGVWGPKSQGALTAAPDSLKLEIQRWLGVKADGLWGPASQKALQALLGAQGLRKTVFSSFADPADVAAFLRCKVYTGKSDVECFAVGDNGIGQFGRITAQEKEPMVAVHRAEMVARWGSVEAAAHRRVILSLTQSGQSVGATVEDRISAPGRVDLNPAAAKALGLHPPFTVPGFWSWAD